MGSDIRLAGCLSRKYGVRAWNTERRAFYAMGYFSSNTPDQMMKMNSFISQKYISYHLIQPHDTRNIWKCHASQWLDGRNRSLHVEWTDYGLTQTKIDVGAQDRAMDFFIMYALRYNNNIIHADSQPVPTFAPGDKERIHPVSYKQSFSDGKIKFEYICSDNVQDYDMLQESFIGAPHYGTRFLIKCPEPKKFYTNNNETTKPRIVQIIPDHK